MFQDLIFREQRLRTNLYDKRDDFTFSIVNFPFICSNIPAALAHGVYLVTNPVISHEWGKDREVFTTSGTCPWSLASLLATTLYQGNPYRDHKLWTIVSSERYILHVQVLLECYYIIRVHPRFLVLFDL
jgi:hypothetical protein